MPIDYLDYAKSAVQMLTTNWFTESAPGEWVPEDYWKTPTICQGLVFYMSSTGDSRLVPTIEAARQSGEGWLNSCQYYDDLTCWGRLFLTAYSYLQNVNEPGVDPKNYLDDANTCYLNLDAAFDSSCSGGVWWRRSGGLADGNIKAANATLGFMEIALGLHAATKDPQYLAAGEKTWTWLKNSGLLDAQGYVWGSLGASCVVDPNNKPTVALQGNGLASLWLMYQASGDTDCLDRAESFVETTMQKFVWPGTQILQAEADAEWGLLDENGRRNLIGKALSKGISLGFLGNFTAHLATLSDPSRRDAARKYTSFLRANADALAAHFPSGAYGVNWRFASPNYQIDSDDQINACLQYSGMSAFIAAAQTVSAGI